MQIIAYTLPSMLFSGKLHNDEERKKVEEKKEVETRLSLRDRHRRHLTIINMTHNNNTTHRTWASEPVNEDAHVAYIIISLYANILYIHIIYTYVD